MVAARSASQGVAGSNGSLQPWSGPGGTGTASLPHVIGHRGAAGHAPENTLVSLRLARDLDAQWVEIDVKLAADGTPVLLHDDLLDRTTNGYGAVAAIKCDALQRLDAGGWFSEGYTNERVPTFEQAIACVLDCGLGLNVEIKPSPGEDEATARIVLDTLMRSWPAIGRKLIVSSFSSKALAVCRDYAPDVPRGFLCHEVPADWRDRMRQLRCATLHPDQEFLTRSIVRELKSESVPVLVYTVNSMAQANDLFTWGVDGIISDYPDRIVAALSKSPSSAQ